MEEATEAVDIVVKEDKPIDNVGKKSKSKDKATKKSKSKDKVEKKSKSKDKVEKKSKSKDKVAKKSKSKDKVEKKSKSKDKVAKKSKSKDNVAERSPSNVDIGQESKPDDEVGKEGKSNDEMGKKSKSKDKVAKKSKSKDKVAKKSKSKDKRAKKNKSKDKVAKKSKSNVEADEEGKPDNEVGEESKSKVEDGKKSKSKNKDGKKSKSNDEVGKKSKSKDEVGKKSKSKDEVAKRSNSNEDEEKTQSIDYRRKIAELFRPKRRCCKPMFLTKMNIQNEWEGKMDDSLNLRVFKYLFPKNAKEITFFKFCDFYASLVEKEPEARGRTICKLANVFKEDPLNVKETSMDCLLKVVSSIIGSFFENRLTVGYRELMEWTGLGAVNCSVDNYQLATTLCSNLPVGANTDGDGTISRVKAEDIADWVKNCPLFDDISRELFKSLYGVPSDCEHSAFLPFPIQEEKLNNTLMALSNVLILNHFTRKRQAKKWVSIFHAIRPSAECWDNFLSSVRGKGPTLTIIQDKHGGVFGMYASQNWFEDENFYGNEECFLFTLKPEVNVYKASGLDGHFQFFNNDGVGMGGELGEFGLFIDRSFRKGFTAEKCKTFHQYTPLTNETEFEIKKAEIWMVSSASSRQSASFFLKDDDLETILQGAEQILNELSDTGACDGIEWESTTMGGVTEDPLDAASRMEHSLSEKTLPSDCKGDAGDISDRCDQVEPQESKTSSRSSRSDVKLSPTKSEGASSDLAKTSYSSSGSDSQRKPSTSSRNPNLTGREAQEPPQNLHFQLLNEDHPCECLPTPEEGTLSEKAPTLKIKMIRPNVCKCTTIELLFPKFSEQESVKVFYEDSTGKTLVK